jgi:hypothetical protein
VICSSRKLIWAKNKTKDYLFVLTMPINNKFYKLINDGTKANTIYLYRAKNAKEKVVFPCLAFLAKGLQSRLQV